MDNTDKFTNANLVRGMIINSAISMERAIDEILGFYFTNGNGRKQDILDFMLSTDRILFENKRRCLESILKLRYPLLHKKYVKTLRCIEQKIIPIRNKFAHYSMEYIGSSEGDLIGLIKIRDGRETNWFTLYDFSQYNEVSGKCVEEIIQLMHDIQKATPQN